MTLRLVCALLTGVVLPASAQATNAPAHHSPWPLLERAAATYRTSTSLTATFTQVIHSEMIGRFESSGELWQAGESRLSMRFRDPPDEAIVADGSSLWIYTPSTAPRQVLRMSLARTPRYGVNVMSWILDEPRARYEALFLRQDAVDGKPVDVIQLTPIDTTLPFTTAVVWLDRTTALPRRVELAERNGTHRTLTLHSPRLDRPVPNGMFTFAVPRGVRIVDQ